MILIFFYCIYKTFSLKILELKRQFIDNRIWQFF